MNTNSNLCHGRLIQVTLGISFSRKSSFASLHELISHNAQSLLMTEILLFRKSSTASRSISKTTEGKSSNILFRSLSTFSFLRFFKESEIVLSWLLSSDNHFKFTKLAISSGTVDMLFSERESLVRLLIVVTWWGNSTRQHPDNHSSCKLTNLATESGKHVMELKLTFKKLSCVSDPISWGSSVRLLHSSDKYFRLTSFVTSLGGRINLLLFSLISTRSSTRSTRSFGSTFSSR